MSTKTTATRVHVFGKGRDFGKLLFFEPSKSRGGIPTPFRILVTKALYTSSCEDWLPALAIRIPPIDSFSVAAVPFSEQTTLTRHKLWLTAIQIPTATSRNSLPTTPSCWPVGLKGPLHTIRSLK